MRDLDRQTDRQTDRQREKVSELAIVCSSFPHATTQCSTGEKLRRNNQEVISTSDWPFQ
jgi:hypothetical protein